MVEEAKKNSNSGKYKTLQSLLNNNENYAEIKNITTSVDKFKTYCMSKGGLDLVLKAKDKEICQNPEMLESIINIFEKSENPQVLSKVVKTFEKDLNKSSSDVLEILNMANQDPDIVSKVLQMKNLTPGIKYSLKTLIKNNNIPQDILNDFIKFQQKNANICEPAMLSGIYYFNRNCPNNKELLQTILKKVKETQNKEIIHLISDTNPNNLEYLKHMHSENKFDSKSIVKFNLIGTSEKFKNKDNWKLIDKTYEETYSPIANTQKTKEGAYYALETAKLQLINPTYFQELQNLGIIDLIKQRKVNPRLTILCRYGEKFTPEVLEDIKMLKNGESLIKKFDNFDNIFQKTKTGDVISVKGKMYINNKGKLERWNMTEEKFNELFPLVDRYTGMQGWDDCYLISALDSIYRNPNSRGSHYKMFAQKGNDIYVTIPAYKNYKGSIKFPNGKIETTEGAANAAKSVQMLEQAYARTALRSGENITTGINPLTTNDLEFLGERNKLGNPKRVIQEVLETNNNIQKRLQKKKNYSYLLKSQAINRIKQYANNPDYILNYGISRPSSQTGHALQIKSYNQDTNTVKFIAPECTAYEQEQNMDELAKELISLCITPVK